MKRLIMVFLAVTIVLTIQLSSLAVILPEKARADDSGKWYSPYTQTIVDKDGQKLEVDSTPVKPPQVKMEAAELPEPDRAGATSTLTSVPAFTWVYGCSATAAGMMAGYYDQPARGYTNIYAGPTNGGVCPMNNEIYWGNTTYPIAGDVGECPLVATHQGKDGLAVRGHVDDFWYDYLSEVDPYWGNWTQHAYANCTADYMGTSQYNNWDSVDGSTSFYYFSNNSPTYDFTGGETDSPPWRDGCHGLRLFFQSRGYTVTSNYNQRIYGYNSIAAGFTYDNFKAQINAGRPVLIQLAGHTMLGYGYSDPSTIAVHDTWDNLDHTMTWGGTYEGLQHRGVTVIELAELTTYTLNISSSSGGTVSNPGIGSFTCNSSEVVPIVATNDSCYRFVNWTGNTTAIANNNSASTTITMNGNYSITANFAINTFTLTYINGSNGTVTGAKTQTVNCSANGTAVTAVPAACYYFVNWSDASVQNPRTDANVTANLTVTANFAITQYNLTVTNNGNGSTSPSGTTLQNCNASVPIVAAANASYRFVNWTGTGAGSVANVSAASTNITMDSNKSVTANFATLVPSEVWVDASWNASNHGGYIWGYNAFDKIQDGIDNVSGSIVHVASGTYYENIVLVDGVELLGAGNATTIIDGMQNGSVVTATNVGNTTVIDGFTLTNGSAASSGGGMYNEGSSPTITNCSFENNSAPYGGGLHNSNSSPTITNCSFNNNSATAGGGMYNKNSASPAITNCVFYNNSATGVSGGGGAIKNFNTDCSPAITGCTFQSNSAAFDGGAIYNGAASAPTINDSVFNNNSATLGGGIYSYTSNAVMTNCIFNSNTANNGSGIYNSGSTTFIINCNLWNNSADYGGGIYNSASTPAIYNCIVWNNSPDGIYNKECSPSVNNCDLQDESYSGGGDYIHVDPSFVDAAGGDFHLNYSSPCIDTGDNMAPFLPDTDFEGDDRVIDGDLDTVSTVDMGVDEYVPPAPATAVVSSDNTSTYGAPVTFTATVTGTILGTPTGNVTFTSNVSGALNTSTLNGTGVATYTTTATQLCAGIHIITAVYNGDSNYSTSTGTLSGNQTVTAKGLTVTGITADSKVYNGSAVATLNTTDYILVGKVGSDVVILNASAYTASFNNASVGTGKSVTVSGLTLSGASAGNYSLTQPTLTANITAKAITVTADNKSKIAGAAMPNLTATATGLVGTDNLSSLSLGYTLNTTATAASPAGTYNITITGGNTSTANYSPIAYVNGTLTVTAGGGGFGGGGGGGGGAAAAEPLIKLHIDMWGETGSSTGWLISSQGILQENASQTSLKGAMTINISKGTKMLGADGKPLVEMSVAPIDPPADAPEGYHVLQAFDFGPDKATFDPGLKITISFNSSGIAPGETVVIATYNETTGKWEFIKGAVIADGIAVFTVTHFSVYAVMYSIPQPTPTPLPIPIETGGGMGTGAIVGIVAGVLVVLALAGYFFVGKKYGWKK